MKQLAIISRDQVNDWLAKLNEIRFKMSMKSLDVSNISNLIDELEEIRYLELEEDE